MDTLQTAPFPASIPPAARGGRVAAAAGWLRGVLDPGPARRAAAPTAFDRAVAEAAAVREPAQRARVSRGTRPTSSSPQTATNAGPRRRRGADPRCSARRRLRARRR